LPMAADPGRSDPAEGLPAALSSALAEFGRHLAAERSLSRHTVRAYLGDVQSLLEHASRHGVADPGALDLATLRGWLAGQHGAGAARATLARRGTDVRARDKSVYIASVSWLVEGGALT
jgi:integrase/recombinase XerC